MRRLSIAHLGGSDVEERRVDPVLLSASHTYLCIALDYNVEKAIVSSAYQNMLKLVSLP